MRDPADKAKETVTAAVRNIRWLPRLLYVALAAYAGILVVATHLPTVSGMVRYPGVDKVLHVIAYAILGTLSATVVSFLFGLSRWKIITGLILLVAFAAIDELTQPWFLRQAELGDWIADCFDY